MKEVKEAKDIMISFDTTGSMYPCLTQVRRHVSNLVTRLFKDVPNLRIGIIAHGDYCDQKSTYITKMLDLTSDKDKIVHFVNNVEATGGGDSPECYEFVLNQVRTTASWSSGKSKILIMIGDDVPHDARESQNFKKLDWKNEIGLIKEAGIKVYSVQALGRRHATHFWQSMADLSDGYYITLSQFSDIQHMITAAGYKQRGDDYLVDYEKELITNGVMNRDLDQAIGTMLGRVSSTRYKISRSKLGAVDGGRFQVMAVDTKCPIRDFVESQGVTFKPGRGFYEFTKRSTIQDYKEVILMDNVTGDLFSGDKAREMAGIPIGVTAELRPSMVPGFTVFVQSTSYNRALQPGTKFLYEIPDWER